MPCVFIIYLYYTRKINIIHALMLYINEVNLLLSSMLPISLPRGSLCSRQGQGQAILYLQRIHSITVIYRNESIVYIRITGLT